MTSALSPALGQEIPHERTVNRHSTVTHYQRPTVTQLQEGGTGGEVSEILFFSAKSKRRPGLIYSMQIIPVCLSIVARRKGVSATRRGGLNWTPISLLVGHPCKLFHRADYEKEWMPGRDRNIQMRIGIRQVPGYWGITIFRSITHMRPTPFAYSEIVSDRQPFVNFGLPRYANFNDG